VWGGGGVEQRPALTGGDRTGEDVLHAGQPGTGPGVEPGCAAGAGDEVEHAGVVVAVGAGQWQVGERTEITGGVGSLGGDGEEQGFVLQVVHGHGRRRRGGANESRVEVASGYKAQISGRGGAAQFDDGLRVAGPVAGEDGVQAGAESFAAGDAQDARIAVGEVGRGRRRPLDRL